MSKSSLAKLKLLTEALSESLSEKGYFWLNNKGAVYFYLLTLYKLLSEKKYSIYRLGEVITPVLSSKAYYTAPKLTKA